MAREGFEMVRYADDRRGRLASPRGFVTTPKLLRRLPRRDHPPVAVIVCRDRRTAEQALRRVQEWTAAAGLTLPPEKTCIVDALAEGFDFRGYHFRADERWPRKKSLAKLKATLRAKTKRTSGHSLEGIIADVNQTLTGWF